ncbi:ATP-binding protein [Pseudogemmobacter bohemicus]|uniref:ATP-binding protein n=1 Tax=Pseudogemmobacter bohemicus TaxID=2250708 RepID=UPI000DD3A101|nr:ATP-binding protein [Pseudogemmobacter bohemicus]
MSFGPRSLFGQTMAILLAGLVLSTAVGAWVYRADREETVRIVGGVAIADRISNLAQLVMQAPPDWQERIVAYSGDETFVVRIENSPMTAEQPNNDAAAAAALAELLARRLALPADQQPVVRISRSGSGSGSGSEKARGTSGHHSGKESDEHSDDSPTKALSEAAKEAEEHKEKAEENDHDEDDDSEDGHSEGGASGQAESQLHVSLPLQDGRWLNVSGGLPGDRATLSNGFFFSMLAMAGVILLASAWAVRRVSRPLAELSEASRRLGENLNAPPMPVLGTTETKQAALAFNGMQKRIRALMDDRTRTLAAISHDFRTPLTLLRLRIETIDETEDRERMLATIADLDAMVAATLELAVAQSKKPEWRRTDMTALLSSITDDFADAGMPVTMATPTADQSARQSWMAGNPIVVECDPAMLKRAITNLIENAVKYGERAEVAISDTAENVEITVSDSGPGIPEEELAHVFEPLYRLEESRSRETGGMGLGLAIVQSIIQAQQGEIVLKNRPEGGLKAVISLSRKSRQAPPA